MSGVSFYVLPLKSDFLKTSFSRLFEELCTEPTSCVMCHSLVNNMMIGDNIVSTECV